MTYHHIRFWYLRCCGCPGLHTCGERLCHTILVVKVSRHIKPDTITHSGQPYHYAVFQVGGNNTLAAYLELARLKG